MNEEQLMVLSFHKAMGFTVNERPTLLPNDLWVKRCKNTQDELIELWLAEIKTVTGEGSIEEIADALGDILYFVYGTAVAHGIDMEPVLREIHRSNLTKDPPAEQDGKAVKGPRYTPPNIKAALAEVNVGDLPRGSIFRRPQP